MIHRQIRDGHWHVVVSRSRADILVQASPGLSDEPVRLLERVIFHIVRSRPQMIIFPHILAPRRPPEAKALALVLEHIIIVVVIARPREGRALQHADVPGRLPEHKALSVLFHLFQRVIVAARPRIIGPLRVRKPLFLVPRHAFSMPNASYLRVLESVRFAETVALFAPFDVVEARVVGAHARDVRLAHPPVLFGLPEHRSGVFRLQDAELVLVVPRPRV